MKIFFPHDTNLDSLIRINEGTKIHFNFIAAKWYKCDHFLMVNSLIQLKCNIKMCVKHCILHFKIFQRALVVNSQ